MEKVLKKKTKEINTNKKMNAKKIKFQVILRKELGC